MVSCPLTLNAWLAGKDGSLGPNLSVHYVSLEENLHKTSEVHLDKMSKYVFVDLLEVMYVFSNMVSSDDAVLQFGTLCWNVSKHILETALSKVAMRFSTASSTIC